MSRAKLPLRNSRWLQRIKFALWLSLAAMVFTLILGQILTLANQSRDGDFGPQNYGPAGTSAVANVARTKLGTEIEIVENPADAVKIAAQKNAPILVFHPHFLTEPDRIALENLVQPVAYLNTKALAFETYEGLQLGLAQSGAQSLPPGCSQAVGAAGNLNTPRTVVKLAETSSPESPDVIASCWHAKNGALWVRFRSAQGAERLLVSDASYLLNSAVKEAPNAVFASALFTPQNLVWLIVPEPHIVNGKTSPTPPYLLPLVIFGMLLVLIAAVIYGRRFGNLIYEPLPVVVPAAETSRGRRALYQRGQDLAHALQVCREAVASSILGRTVEPKVDFETLLTDLSERTQLPLARVRELFIYTPNSNSEFIKLMKDLQSLESETAE